MTANRVAHVLIQLLRFLAGKRPLPKPSHLDVRKIVILGICIAGFLGSFKMMRHGSGFAEGLVCAATAGAGFGFEHGS
jgi:hypothetical protein